MLTGLETRTSSPVRLLRDKENLQCTGLAGLYPCGEGAGYAGGIMTAAVDGVRCAAELMKLGTDGGLMRPQGRACPACSLQKPPYNRKAENRTCPAPTMQ